MGLLINLGRVRSQMALYVTYFLAFIFAVVGPIIMWKKHFEKPPEKRLSTGGLVLATLAIVAVTALVVFIARWYNAKVQSSKAWATFDGATSVAGAAKDLFSSS